LAGGVILGVALWLRHDPQTTNLLYLELGDRPAPNTFYVGIYILIAVGAVMMFVGFLGCYGAIQESQCLLGTVRSGAGWGREGAAEAEPRVLLQTPRVQLRRPPPLPV